MSLKILHVVTVATALVGATVGTVVPGGVANANPDHSLASPYSVALRGEGTVGCSSKDGRYAGQARIEIVRSGNDVTASVTGYKMGTNGNSRANLTVRLFANGSTYTSESDDTLKMDNVWRDGLVASKSTEVKNTKPISAMVDFVFDVHGVTDPECGTAAVYLT